MKLADKLTDMEPRDDDAPLVERRITGSAAVRQLVRDMIADQHPPRGPEPAIPWSLLARRVAKIGATAIAGIVAGVIGTTAIDPSHTQTPAPVESPSLDGLALTSPPSDAVRLRCDPVLLGYLEHVSREGSALAAALDADGMTEIGDQVRSMTSVAALGADLRLCLLHRELDSQAKHR